MEKKSCPGCDRLITPLTGGGLRAHGPVGNRCTQVAPMYANEAEAPAPRKWAHGTKGWELHIVRHGAALCERPVSSVRLTDAEADNKLVANQLTRKCFGCTDTDNKENGMASETTTRTGPLTELQMSIMTGLMQGKSNVRVGVEHGKGRTHTANIVAAAVAKMGCENSRQAIAMLATRNAYLEAAGLIEAGVIRGPLDGTEEHVNHVLVDLAQILRDRAAKLLPS